MTRGCGDWLLEPETDLDVRDQKVVFCFYGATNSSLLVVLAPAHHCEAEHQSCDFINWDPDAPC